MSNEILINDGGAPCRILPFVSGQVITAGQVVKIATDGEVEMATDEDFPIAGVLLTDAAVGDTANVVSGSGVILNMKCAAAVVMGNVLKVNEGAAGELIVRATGDTDSKNVAYALETTGVRGLVKCLVV
jgi:hypothetical protein